MLKQKGICIFISVMDSLSFYTKYSILPPSLKKEVEDFLEFIQTRQSPVPARNKPVFGSAKGKIKLSPDFDEPLEDFKDYM